MRCPHCRSLDRDRVIDSRTADGGAAIRRRRQCEACGQRFTTFERPEAVTLTILKRSGEEVAYERDKVISGLERACVNRPVDPAEIERVADEVEELVRASGGRPVPSQEVGLAILDRLREIDEVAYVRFASVYKDFQEIGDFERELGSLLRKQTPPKRATQG